MIYISPTGSTVITCMLYGRCRNTIDPLFAWEVTRKETFETYVFYQNDISPDPQYYNQFLITIGTNSSGLTYGVVPFFPGTWEYNVYEISTISDIYSLTDCNRKVSNGLIRIDGTYSTIPTYVADTYSIPTYQG